MAVMRSLAAALALFLAFLTGTAALGSYVAHEVLLDPSHAGPFLDTALGQPDVRNHILNQVVPGYGALPAPVRDRVDEVAQSPSARRALKRVSLDGNGNLDLTPLRGEVVRALRSNGLPQLAALVAAQRGVTSVQVPSTYFSRYNDARRTSWLVATRGGLATLVLFVLALLVSPWRTGTVRAIGVTLLLCCAVDALAFWLLPPVARASSSSPLADAAADVVRAQHTPVLLALLPAALVGLVLIAASLLVPRRTRRPSRA